MRVFIRPSSFRLPESTETPIILIGPGTGIAPMRALLQERAYQREQGAKIGEVVLYFGCKVLYIHYVCDIFGGNFVILLVFFTSAYTHKHMNKHTE
jgi:hypothetical protein